MILRRDLDMGVPQIIYILLTATVLLIAMNLHGKPKKGKHNYWSYLASTLIQLGILMWGGFFAL